jgi:hypothetical protein
MLGHVLENADCFLGDFGPMPSPGSSAIFSDMSTSPRPCRRPRPRQGAASSSRMMAVSCSSSTVLVRSASAVTLSRGVRARLAQAMAERAAARIETAHARVLAEHEPRSGRADGFGAA